MNITSYTLWNKYDALWDKEDGKMYPTMHLFFPLFNPTMHQICGILLFEIGLNLVAPGIVLLN